jgi:hypothetical protein
MMRDPHVCLPLISMRDSAPGSVLGNQEYGLSASVCLVGHEVLKCLADGTGFTLARPTPEAKKTPQVENL